MTGVLRWLVVREIVVAVHISAFGRWWAAHAGARLEKLSGRVSRRRGLKARDADAGAPDGRGARP